MVETTIGAESFVEPTQTECEVSATEGLVKLLVCADAINCQLCLEAEEARQLVDEIEAAATEAESQEPYSR